MKKWRANATQKKKTYPYRSKYPKARTEPSEQIQWASQFQSVKIMKKSLNTLIPKERKLLASHSTIQNAQKKKPDVFIQDRSSGVGSRIKVIRN